jgi:hypothetical protein
MKLPQAKLQNLLLATQVILKKRLLKMMKLFSNLMKQIS